MKRSLFTLGLIFLGTLSGKCQVGQFSFTLTSDSITNGALDETLFAYAELANNTAFDVQLLMIREVNEMPEGWGSAICTNVCQAPEVDTALQYLPANSMQDFIMYFYTNETANTGFTRMKFINLDDPSNFFYQGFRGITSETTEIEIAVLDNEGLISVGPNPFRDQTSFIFDQPHWLQYSRLWIVIYHNNGQLVTQIEVTGQSHLIWKRNNLPAGTYFYNIVGDGALVAHGKLLAE